MNLNVKIARKAERQAEREAKKKARKEARKRKRLERNREREERRKKRLKEGEIILKQTPENCKIVEREEGRYYLLFVSVLHPRNSSLC